MQHERDSMLQSADDDKYPSPTDAHATLAPQTMHRNCILTNVTHVLHHLRCEARNRILIVLERPEFGSNLSGQIHLPRLSLVTGIDIVRVDGILKGKATEFSAVKRRFDSPDPRPMALLCFGVIDTFMVGTDLASADAIVVVGNIPSYILTQAVARTLRPNDQRDNTRPIPQINIYSR